MRQSIHLVLQAIGFLINILTFATNVVPAKYQPYVVATVSLLQGLLAWYNHNFNPDGTPATVAYVPKP